MEKCVASPDVLSLSVLLFAVSSNSRSLKIIGNSNLKLPSAKNLIKCKSSQFVLNCLQNVCTPFKTYLKDHFTLRTQGTMAYQWNYLKFAWRWLETVSSTYILMGRYNQSLSLDATIMVSKNCPKNCPNNFRKFKVALNPMYRMFLNLGKSCVLSCLSNVDNIKKFHRAVFEL